MKIPLHSFSPASACVREDRSLSGSLARLGFGGLRVSAPPHPPPVMQMGPSSSFAFDAMEVVSGRVCLRWDGGSERPDLLAFMHRLEKCEGAGVLI